MGELSPQNRKNGPRSAAVAQVKICATFRLSARDKRHYLVILARISRDEALEAVEMVRDQQHRFMLI